MLLTGACGTVEISEPDPVSGLTNITWSHRSISGREAGYPGAHMYFDPETWHLSGSTGCNVLTGNYKI
jgi:heat shock protein HslJ